MAARIIRLCYRKIINASSQKPWDNYVFESSYQEFMMQSQFYNQEKKYSSFAELLVNVPGAEKLNFLVSAAVTGYVQQLKGIVPDILDNLGRHFLKFKEFRFEIISSDIKNKPGHQVAINFFSEPLQWQATINDHLLLSSLDSERHGGAILTQLVQVKPFLSIYSIQNETF